MPEKKITNKINKNISKYKKKIFQIFFLARVLSIPKKLLHIVRNEIKKNHDNRIKNKKFIQSYKMPKKLNIFSSKIHKGARI